MAIPDVEILAVRLSTLTLATIVADCRRIRRQSPFSVTVAVFGDNVDRALQICMYRAMYVCFNSFARCCERVRMHGSRTTEFEGSGVENKLVKWALPVLLFRHFS